MTYKQGTVAYHPVQVMDGAIPARFAYVACAILIAALVMLCLGSKALLDWANNLPINEATDYLLTLAQNWQDWMDKVGVTKYADYVHKVLAALQALRW